VGFYFSLIFGAFLVLQLLKIIKSYRNWFFSIVNKTIFCYFMGNFFQFLNGVFPKEKEGKKKKKKVYYYE